MTKFQWFHDPLAKETSATNWDAVAEDVTELNYQLTGQNELDCAIKFPFTITLHFEDGDRTFGPTTGLLTDEQNANTVCEILNEMRKPYIIFNDHLTAPAGKQEE